MLVALLTLADKACPLALKDRPRPQGWRVSISAPMTGVGNEDSAKSFVRFPTPPAQADRGWKAGMPRVPTDGSGAAPICVVQRVVHPQRRKRLAVLEQTSHTTPRACTVHGRSLVHPTVGVVLARRGLPMPAWCAGLSTGALLLND